MTLNEELAGWFYGFNGVVHTHGNRREQLTLERFNATPIFQQCIREANGRAYKRQEANRAH